MKIPVSVIVATRNEEKAISRCLAALRPFDEVIVADSCSTDNTAVLARAQGAMVVEFTWNGRYPKKRQWCLDHLPLRHDWVFFVDADEIVTPELCREMAGIDWGRDARAGYFVRGDYVMNGRVLRHGLANKKLALLHRGRMEFPVVDDLDLPGMGEIEGHYQPLRKQGQEGCRIGVLRSALLHYACEDIPAWRQRHVRYAAWETGMNRKNAWPGEVTTARAFMKRFFRSMPLRAEAAFIYAYVVKGGFLDGRAGFDLAAGKAAYYRAISKASKSRAPAVAATSSDAAPRG